MNVLVGVIIVIIILIFVGFGIYELIQSNTGAGAGLIISGVIIALITTAANHLYEKKKLMDSIWH